MNEVFEKIKQTIIYHCDERKYRYELGKVSLDYCVKDIMKIVDQVVEEYVHDTNVGKNNGWIPCSERLPSAEETWNYVEEDDVYEPNEFIVMIDGATLPTVLFYDSISNKWTDGDDDVYKVIAWQPLPAPYGKE